MTGDVCLDASIIVKLALAEDDSELADALVVSAQNDGRIIVPLHLHPEATSAVYKRLRASLITIDEARTALTQFASLPLQLRHPSTITRTAVEIASKLRLKYPYDAFYLALGELLDCDVWTADRVLHAAAHASFPRLRLLSDFNAGQE